MDIAKLLGINVDPKKVNEVITFAMIKLTEIEQRATLIEAHLADMVELKKQELEILARQVKK